MAPLSHGLHHDTKYQPGGSTLSLPACPIPLQIDVEARVRELQEMIDNPDTKEDQKQNLRMAIELYHTGKMAGVVGLYSRL